MVFTWELKITFLRTLTMSYNVEYGIISCATFSQKSGFSHHSSGIARQKLCHKNSFMHTQSTFGDSQPGVDQLIYID